MRKILSIIDSISEWTGKIVSWFLIILLAAMIYEIVARYIFNAPTEWSMELTTMLFGAQAILVGGYVLRIGGHVNVDVFYGRFSRRGQAILDSFTFLLLFLFCIVILLKGWEMGWDALMRGEHSGSAWNPPVYPIKLAIPVGAFLILLQGLATYIRIAFTALTGRSLDD